MYKPNKTLAATLWLLAISLLAIMSYLIATKTLYVSVDTGIYLDSGRAILAGAIPYIDFVDINPPLAMYLHTPIVWIAQFIDTDIVATFFVVIIIATIAVSVGSFSLAERIVPRYGQAVAFSIALTLVYSLYNFHSSWFGQREHLFIMALLPYLILRVARLNGTAPPTFVCLAIGLYIGLMASLKPPQFGFILIGIELYLCSQSRSLRLLATPEIAAGITIAIIYVAIFSLFGGASFEIFIERYVPLIINSYDAMNDPESVQLPKLFRNLGFDVAIVCIGWLATRWLTSTQPIRDLSSLALITCITGCVVYISQAKGFGYHEIPVKFAANLTLCTLVGLLIYKALCKIDIQSRAFPYTALLSIAFALAGILATKASIGQASFRYSQPPAKLMMQHSSAGERIAFFGFTPLWYYPMLVQQDRYLGTRYAFSFMIPMLYENASKDLSAGHGYRVSYARVSEENLFKQEIELDIQRLKPELIIILRQDCLWCLEGLTMEDYLLGQPEDFTFLQKYSEIQSDEWYLVLRRNE
jgi:hypothetical protein